MISYKDLADKRVALILAEDEGATIISGKVKLEEDGLQLHPDDPRFLEKDGEALGLRYEQFDDDIITQLEQDSAIRTRFNCDYAILLED